MNTINKIDKMVDRVNMFGVYISGIAILLMMCMIALEIILRSVFSSSIPGGYLIVQNYFMPLVVFPALAYAFKSGIFPRLDIVVDKVKSQIAKMCIIVAILLVELICCVILAYFGFVMGLEGAEEGRAFLTGNTYLPLYPFFFFVGIAFTMVSIKITMMLLKLIVSKGEYNPYDKGEIESE